MCFHTERNHGGGRNLFAELLKAVAVEMPLNNIMWKAYFKMVTDKFGIQG